MLRFSQRFSLSPDMAHCHVDGSCEIFRSAGSWMSASAYLDTATSLEASQLSTWTRKVEEGERGG